MILKTTNSDTNTQKVQQNNSSDEDQDIKTMDDIHHSTHTRRCYSDTKTRTQQQQQQQYNDIHKKMAHILSTPPNKLHYTKFSLVDKTITTPTNTILRENKLLITSKNNKIGSKKGSLYPCRDSTMSPHYPCDVMVNVPILTQPLQNVSTSSDISTEILNPARLLDFDHLSSRNSPTIQSSRKRSACSINSSRNNSNTISTNDNNTMEIDTTINKRHCAIQNTTAIKSTNGSSDSTFVSIHSANTNQTMSTPTTCSISKTLSKLRISKESLDIINNNNNTQSTIETPPPHNIKRLNIIRSPLHLPSPKISLSPVQLISPKVSAIANLTAAVASPTVAAIDTTTTTATDIVTTTTAVRTSQPQNSISQTPTKKYCINTPKFFSPRYRSMYHAELRRKKKEHQRKVISSTDSLPSLPSPTVQNSPCTKSSFDHTMNENISMFTPIRKNHTIAHLDKENIEPNNSAINCINKRASTCLQISKQQQQQQQLSPTSALLSPSYKESLSYLQRKQRRNCPIVRGTLQQAFPAILSRQSDSNAIKYRPTFIS